MSKSQAQEPPIVARRVWVTRAEAEAIYPAPLPDLTAEVLSSREEGAEE